MLVVLVVVMLMLVLMCAVIITCVLRVVLAVGIAVMLRVTMLVVLMLMLMVVVMVVVVVGLILLQKRRLCVSMTEQQETTNIKPYHTRKTGSFSSSLSRLKALQPRMLSRSTLL